MVKNVRKYDKEFKREAINLALSGKKSIGEIAKGLGMARTTLYSWTYKANRISSKEYKPEVEQELRSLRKELLSIKEERDILKKAMAIFSRKK